MILLTGATGHIGKRVAELLGAVGIPLRLMARDLSKILNDGHSEMVQANYGDQASLDIAFKGIRKAFLVSGYAPPGERALLHKNAIDAAARAGVKELVYLSFQGASSRSAFPMSRDHFQTEQYLEDSGITYTALRDSFYMDLIPEMFGKDGIMKGPAGHGRVAWVSREDVAKAVSNVLLNSSSFNEIYDLTGPESLSLHETALRISRLTGHKLRYVDEPLEESYTWRRELGAPEWEVDTWVGSYLAIAQGELEQVSSSIESLTGHIPMDLETYFSSKGTDAMYNYTPPFDFGINPVNAKMH